MKFPKLAALSSALAFACGQNGNAPPKKWAQLNQILEREDAVIGVSAEEFIKHCTDEMDVPYEWRTNWHLQFSNLERNSGQTSALCMAIMFCAFQDCNPNPDHTNIPEAIKLSIESRSNGQDLESQTKWKTLPQNVKDWIKSENNPSSNLPEAEMTPFSAREVKDVVEFARDNGYKLSIKNSGHSYAGQSTKRGTLLLGMKRMPRLSSREGKGIVTCDPDWRSNNDKFDPCRLAAARGKPGYVQIGGGENFAEVYTSVKKYNENRDEYKFQAFGGASATVSPFGYSMMGGLSGTTGGRRHGFGADQILMAEMVLPTGEHVRFGPTDWTKPRGDELYPQTKKVEGQCCGTYDGGSCSDWKSCPEEISFNRLWRSFRGGGGGWGVVISMSQQLHTYEQFGEFNFRNNPNCQLDLSGGALLQKAGFIAQVFWNKYYLDDDYFVNSNANTRFPAKYEVGPPKSDDNRTFNDMRTACSTPSVLSGPMFCDGEGYAERALKTYHTFLDNWNEIVEDEGYGVYGMKFAEDAEKQNFKDCASAPSKSNIQNLKAWIDVNKAGGGGKPNRFNDGVEEVIERWEAQPSPMASALYCAGQYQKKISNTLGGEKECLAAEFDCPDFTSPNDDSAPVLVPKDFLVDGSAIPTGSATMNDRFIPMTYMAFGPGTMNGSDGMDSVSRAMRIAGTWSGLPLVDPGNPGMAVYDDNFFTNIFPKMYKEVDQTSGYLPAFINPMHVGPYTRGPMKANWNKACPLEWSKKRRDRDCFSLQESIFGTKLLCQLETSKQVIDRDGMMTPPYGVGDLDDDALGELRQRCPRNARNTDNEDNLAEWTLFPPPARKDVCRGLGIRTCPSVLDCTRSAAEGLNSREFGPSCSKDNPSVQDCLNDLCRCCEERNPEPTCDFAQIEGTYTHFGGHNCPQQAALGGAYFGSHTGRVEINCDDQNRCKFKETISTLLGPHVWESCGHFETFDPAIILTLGQDVSDCSEGYLPDCVYGRSPSCDPSRSHYSNFGIPLQKVSFPYSFCGSRVMFLGYRESDAGLWFSSGAYYRSGYINESFCAFTANPVGGGGGAPRPPGRGGGLNECTMARFEGKYEYGGGGACSKDFHVNIRCTSDTQCVFEEHSLDGRAQWETCESFDPSNYLEDARGRCSLGGSQNGIGLRKKGTSGCDPKFHFYAIAKNASGDASANALDIHFSNDGGQSFYTEEAGDSPRDAQPRSARRVQACESEEEVAKRGESKRGKAKASKEGKAKASKEGKAKASKDGKDIFA